MIESVSGGEMQLVGFNIFNTGVISIFIIHISWVDDNTKTEIDKTLVCTYIDNWYELDGM